jgi:hypothetical protein
MPFPDSIASKAASMLGTEQDGYARIVLTYRPLVIEN